MKLTVLILLLILLSFISPLQAEAVTQWCDDANAEVCVNIETGSGTSLVDQSANSNNGTFKASGEPAWDSNVPGSPFVGTSTWSVDFDGADDYVTFGDISGVENITTLSAVAWVYHEAISNDDYIWEKWTPSTTSGGFILLRDDSGFSSGRTDIYKVLVEETTGGSDSNRCSIEGATNASSITTWTHVAMTFLADNASGCHLYVDGVEDANSPVSSTNVTEVGINSQSLFLGVADTTNNEFNGDIDEAAIFSIELSSTDINDIMDNGLVQAAATARRRILIMDEQ